MSLIPTALKILSASDNELTPQFAADLARKAPVSDVSYMVAHERHRRGLPVKMVRP